VQSYGRPAVALFTPVMAPAGSRARAIRNSWSRTGDLAAGDDDF
jgi:hypothetical protein